MQPEIDVLGVSIKTFGVFFALNFIAWGALVHRRLREVGKPPDWAYEIVAVALLGGLIGARGYWLAQNHESLSFGNILGGSGLIWYGGLAGGIVAVLAWARWRDFLSLALVDVAGPGLALGYAIGRIGCQVSGDGDYGKAWNGPWAMGYSNGTVPTAPGETVHPTPIYETVVMGLVAYVLWRLRDRVRPGVLFASYLVIAGIERFLIEFIRRNDDVALSLTAAQLWSLGQLVIGVVWLLAVQRRGGLLRTDGQAPGRGAALPAT
jgi:phosphatidylglycerol---prolipoprotein diacylglyceryl transferase